LPRHRLVRGADFQRVYQRRCVASDETLVVYALENGLAHPRLGLSVSRKVGGAVQRNRWKRLLREAFRLQIAELPGGIDLVAIPRPAVEPELTAIKESLRKLARRVANKLSKEKSR
jgi:ribonuclease P protein component